jgi:hypothetical protein
VAEFLFFIPNFSGISKFWAIFFRIFSDLRDRFCADFPFDFKELADCGRSEIWVRFVKITFLALHRLPRVAHRRRGSGGQATDLSANRRFA